MPGVRCALARFLSAVAISVVVTNDSAMICSEEVLIYLQEAVMLVTTVEIMFDVNISKEELGASDEDYRRVTVNKLAERVCRKKGL
ncbi:MAG TPA: hypothetical protein VIQ24_16830 [Pyrinomonadaceae bacterium]